MVGEQRPERHTSPGDGVRSDIVAFVSLQAKETWKHNEEWEHGYMSIWSFSQHLKYLARCLVHN